MMLATGSEQNRHAKRHDCAEADPPGKFHAPGASSVEYTDCAPKMLGDAVRQTAQYRDDDEADNHGDDVAEIVAAAFGKHSAEKNPEQRAIGVTEIPEHNRDDPHIRDARSRDRK